MAFFDTHIHIGLIHKDPIEQLIIIQEAKRKKVDMFLNICNNVVDFIEVYEKIKTTPGVYFAVGTSPTELGKSSRDWHDALSEYLSYDKVIAVGETGLDYEKRFGSQDTQVKAFIEQLEIAQHYDKPVVIHNRGAGKDIVEILSNKMPDKGAIFHCYSEDINLAKKILSKHDNVLFSFAGSVTYKVSQMHEVIRQLPLDKIAIESESPFLVPSAYKGKRNKPAYLEETGNYIANLRPEDNEEVLDALYNNPIGFFGIKV